MKIEKMFITNSLILKLWLSVTSIITSIFLKNNWKYPITTIFYIYEEKIENNKQEK